MANVTHAEIDFLQQLLRTLIRCQGYLMGKGEDIKSPLYEMINRSATLIEDRQRKIMEKDTR